MDVLLIKVILLLIGALLGAALAPLGSTSIAVAVPVISDELGVSTTLTTQLLVGGYLFICIVGQGPGGRLADTIGTIRTLYLGLAMFVAGTVLGYLMADLTSLTVSRMLMALGTAFISPATQSLLRRRMPARMLSTAFGIYGTTMSAAAALGPWVGALIVESGHWSLVFALNIPLALLSAVLIGLVVAGESEQSPGEHNGKFDFGGLVLLAAGVFCFQAAGASDGIMRTICLVLLPVFVGLLIFHVRRNSYPIFQPELFRNEIYRLCCVVNALNNLVMYSLLFHVPILVLNVWNLAPVTAGSTLLAMTLGMMTAGMVTGVLINLYGPKWILALAQLLILAGLTLLNIAILNTDQSLLVPALTLCGLGLGTTMPCVQVVGLGSISSSLAGSASGVLNTFRYVGGAAGISLMTFILGQSESSLEVHQFVLFVYGVSSCVVLLAANFMPRKLNIVT